MRKKVVFGLIFLKIKGYLCNYLTIGLIVWEKNYPYL